MLSKNAVISLGGRKDSLLGGQACYIRTVLCMGERRRRGEGRIFSQPAKAPKRRRGGGRNEGGNLDSEKEEGKKRKEGRKEGRRGVTYKKGRKGRRRRRVTKPYCTYCGTKEDFFTASNRGLNLSMFLFFFFFLFLLVLVHIPNREFFRISRVLQNFERYPKFRDFFPNFEIFSKFREFSPISRVFANFESFRQFRGFFQNGMPKVLYYTETWRAVIWTHCVSLLWLVFQKMY